ncbi:MAG: glycosyltransferase family 87 protein [bacterium]|nr:glycosyltransferase family 87 protein [bacterium]
MTTAQRQVSIALVILVAVVIGNVIVTHNLFTSRYPGHNDFMSRWEGARSYWIDGLNPYGVEASLNIQERIYGRAATPVEDPGYFAYPFYTVFVVAPVVTLDYAWASSIWMVLLEACLIGAFLLILDILKWRPAPLLLGVLLLWVILDYFAMRGLLLGQPGIIVYALEMFTIWAFLRGYGTAAGVALAVSTLKPQMGFLFVPLMLLIALFAREPRRRWGTLIGFGVTMAILLGLSFLLMPSWLGDWVAQVSLYTSYTAIGSPVWVVTQYYLGLGTAGEYGLSALLLGYMLWAWFQLLIRRKTERLLWTVTLTLTVTHLIAVRTATTHYVVFVLPILFYLHELAKQRRGWLAALIVFGIAGITWAHFLTTVQGEFEHPSLYLPLPFTLLFLLIVTRHRWWRTTRHEMEANQTGTRP